MLNDMINCPIYVYIYIHITLSLSHLLELHIPAQPDLVGKETEASTVFCTTEKSALLQQHIFLEVQRLGGNCSV